MLRRPVPAAVATAIAPVVWGTTYVVTSELLPPGRPLLAGVLRALPAGLLLLAATRELPRGVWVTRSLVLGTLYFGVFFPLLFLAAYRLPGGLAAVVGSVGPLLTLVVAWLLLGERPTRRRAVAGVAAVVGVGLITGAGGTAVDAVGVLAALGGSVSMVLASVLTKRWGTPAGTSRVAFTGWQLVAGGAVLVPVAWLVEGPPPALDAAALAGFAWLAIVGTALAYWLWMRGAERLEAGALGALPVLSPVTATVLGWVLLGQALSPLQLLGLAVALAASVVGAAPRRPVATPDRPAPDRSVAVSDTVPHAAPTRHRPASTAVPDERRDAGTGAAVPRGAPDGASA